MEAGSEIIYSMNSYNDLAFHTLDSQGLYNSVSMLPVTTSCKLYKYYTFRKNLCAVLSTPMKKHVSYLIIPRQWTYLDQLLLYILLAFKITEDKTFSQQEVNMLLNSILDGSENASSIVNNMEMPNVSEQIEDCDETPQTLLDILSKLQHKIGCDSLNKFNVFRTDIFNCCVRAMRRKTFRPFNKLSVKFSDCEGVAEGAVDEGGPTRELFRLALSFLQNSQLFTGAIKKNISLHNTSLNEKLYYEAGRLISLSLVHGGPGPHFFSETLFSMLTAGVQNTLPTLDDVDTEIRNKLILLKDTVNLLELQEIVTSENIFSIAGCHYIKHVDEKWKILDGKVYF